MSDDSRTASAASNTIGYQQLWQPAFDVVWNAISTFVVGPESRGDLPKCAYNEVFLNGGRGSGKSTVVSKWIWMALTNDHHKNAVVIRKVASTIRKSCFKQMVKSLKSFRLEGFWDINKTDLTITHKETGQQVVFVGLDDEEKVRSLTTDDENKYFAIAWFEEAKQFPNYEEIAQAKASILRGGAEMISFLTYNPPKSAASWINKEARLQVEGRYVHKSTYLTMPPEWLGPEFIKTAEQIRLAKPNVYRHMYLGEVTGTGGLYFGNIRTERIPDEFIGGLDYILYAVDFGKNDPNVFLAGYYDENADTLYVFDEIYRTHLPYKKFGAMIVEKGVGDEYVICDCQNDAAIETLEDIGVNCCPCMKGKDTRIKGGTWLNELTAIVIDPDRCPNAAEELQLFEYRQNPDGSWTDEPSKKDDHCFDTLRYMTQEYWHGGRIGLC